MIKIESVEVMGWEAAIRGMRNPMNSWEKSDSEPGCEIVSGSHEFCRECDHAIDIHGHLICGQGYDAGYVIGLEDFDLMTRLRNAGTDHRKFMRMITVYLDITAPLYWWKEFDTYKVGTVANSCSTMHKIAAKKFTLEDFSHEHLSEPAISILKNTIEALNQAGDLYLGYDGFKHRWGDWEKKHYWWQMIQLLPSSYNQRRTVMLNYEVLVNMYKSRKNHKLDEWREFCKWIESLPYSELITVGFIIGVDLAQKSDTTYTDENNLRKEK